MFTTCPEIAGQRCPQMAVRSSSASGGNGPSEVNQLMWRNRATVGQQLARVVEADDAVAQQAPPLLGVEGDDVGRVTVRAVS